VRYRLMATYQGSPFEAGIGPTDGDIVLFAACPPPEELGFEPATGHWRKQLRVADVQAVWESRPVGTFRGERCMVLDDLGDRLHIGYLGHDGFKAEQLGYWQVDRGVFELVAPRTEVADILEERTEYPRAVPRPVTAPQPVVPPQQVTAPHPVVPPPPAGPAAPGAPTSSSLGRRDSTGYPVPVATSNPAGYQAADRYPTPDGPEYARRPSGQYPDPASMPEAPGSSGQYTVPASLPEAPRDSGQYTAPTGYGLPDPPADSGQIGGELPTAYLPVPDSSTGVALPVTAEAPLPLEAEAMRAASAARRPRQAARRGAPAADALPAPGSAATPPVAANPPTAPSADAATQASQPWSRPAAMAADILPAPAPAGLAIPPSPASMSPADSKATAPAAASLATASLAAANPATANAAAAPPVAAAPPASRQRRGARRRMATEQLFADLAALAGIPADSYAIGEAVEGALCLVQTGQRFEVFHSAGGDRHELQVFTSEESACFYLFGLLAAEAVRNGSLARVTIPAGLSAGEPQTT
jgi:hypothetical protein